jgi:hypothetical protein
MDILRFEYGLLGLESGDLLQFSRGVGRHNILGSGVDEAIIVIIDADAADGSPGKGAVNVSIFGLIVGLEVNHLAKACSHEDTGHVEAYTFNNYNNQRHMHNTAGGGREGQKQPERVTPPHTIIMMM